MSAKQKYIIPIFNTAFSSMEDAKWNVQVAFSRREAIKYLSNTNEKIYHYIGDMLHSETPIKCDEHGNISFGKTTVI